MSSCKHETAASDFVGLTPEFKQSVPTAVNSRNEDPIDLEMAGLDFFGLELVDRQRIEEALNEAGSSACGIQGIDIWLLNESDGRLHHFGQGLNWVNPVYRKQLEDNADAGDGEKLQLLNRLVDVNNPEYYHPIPQPQGVGLAGNYWQQYGDQAGSASHFAKQLFWREVRSFTSDPDQMPYERMFAIEKVFGKCTGVPFNVFGESKGIVMFYARGTAEDRIINTAINSKFLRLASMNIGTALAMSRSRVQSMEARRNLARKLFHRARMGFAMATLFKNLGSERQLRSQSTGSDTCASAGVSDPFKKGITSFRDHATHRCKQLRSTARSFAKYARTKATNVRNKTLRPPGIKPPPAASFSVSSWTFVSCFTILVVLFGIQNLSKNLSDGKVSLVLPPFGAFMVLQFSLTAAPAAQPRNSFFGFILAISIVMVNKILLHHLAGLPQWFHASLGPSLAIFAKQKCGFVHPPAGAAAIVFALSKKSIASDFLHSAVFMVADLVAITLAVLLNNLSDTRQYPMYWKLNPLSK